LIETLEKIIWGKAVIQKLPLQPGDVERTLSNINKAKRKLTYAPFPPFEIDVEKIYLLAN